MVTEDDPAEEISTDVSEEVALTDIAKISFQTILGKTSGATMKLKGDLNGREVIYWLTVVRLIISSQRRW